MQILALSAAVCLFLSSAVSSEEKEQPKELIVDVLELPASCDAKAATGDKISMHYTGTLFSNGNKFDSSPFDLLHWDSHDRGSPLDLTLGIGQVIPGWDEGLQGMCLNEKRRLTIPPGKAYGSRGFGTLIPPNSALVFEVELVNLKKSNREEL